MSTFAAWAWHNAFPIAFWTLVLYIIKRVFDSFRGMRARGYATDAEWNSSNEPRTHAAHTQASTPNRAAQRNEKKMPADYTQSTFSSINGVVQSSFRSVTTTIKSRVGVKTYVAIGFWVACIVASFLSAVVADGVAGRHKYLATLVDKKVAPHDEWAVLSDAAYRNSHQHFWNSLFLPYTFVAKIVPFFIVWWDPLPAGFVYV